MCFQQVKDFSAVSPSLLTLHAPDLYNPTDQTIFIRTLLILYTRSSYHSLSLLLSFFAEKNLGMHALDLSHLINDDFPFRWRLICRTIPHINNNHIIVYLLVYHYVLSKFAVSSNINKPRLLINFKTNLFTFLFFFK